MRNLPAVLLLFTVACSGIYASNVGEPTSGEKLLFNRALARLEVGMPEDSLLAMFEEADEPGDAGILYKSRVRFENFERTTYTLGWKSEPKHQGDYKRPEDIDQVAALVEVREGKVHRINRNVEKVGNSQRLS